VTDLDGYLKEYAPKAQASANAYGGRILAAGQEVAAIEEARCPRAVGQPGPASGLAQLG
jgi:uncharacterized protein (DUF1330 family)